MEIILLFAMLFLSAFLVAAETALSSLKKIHMKGNEAVYTENGKDKSCSLKSTGKGSIEQ